MKMRSHEQTWSYSLLVEESVRLPALLSGDAFNHVAEQISNEMRVLCCHSSSISISTTVFRRPVYTLQVDPSLFDLFFNSPFGYRGAYFKSPGFGLDANALLMELLAPKLVADSLSRNSGLSESFLRESLSTPSAKAWLAEAGKEPDTKCPFCKGEWSVKSSGSAQLAEIRNGKWDTASGQKAEWGRKAPYVTKIRIMGAFITSDYHELVPFDKRFRALEIHNFGWS